MAVSDIYVRLTPQDQEKVLAALARVRDEAAKVGTAGGHAGHGMADGFNLATHAAYTTRGALLQIEMMAARMAIVGAVSALSVGLVQAGMAAERLALQFKAAAGSAEAGAREYEFAKKLAEDLGLQLDATTQAWARFLIATKGTSLEGEEARRVFAALAKAMTSLQLPAEQQTSAWIQLNQMVSKTKVNQQDMRVLAESFPGIYQAIAEALGVTTAELFKQMEAGRVLTSDVLPKLADHFEKTTGASAQEGAQKSTSAWNRFRNEIVLTARDVGERLMPAFTGFFNAVAERMRSLRQTLREVRDIQSDLANGAEKAARASYDAAFVAYNRLAARTALRGALGLGPYPGDPEKLKALEERLAMGPNTTGRRPVDESPDAEVARNAERARKEREAAEKDAAEKLATARREARERELDAELRTEQERTKTLLAVNEAEHDQGLKSLKAYWDERERITLAGLDGEIAVLQRKLGLARDAQKAAADPAEQARLQADVAQVEERIAQKRQDRLQAEARLLGDRSQALQKLARDLTELDAKVAESQGDKFAAARLEVDKFLRDAEQKLRDGGMTGDELERSLAAMRAAKLAVVDFDAAKQRADLAMNDLERRRQAIQDQVTAGQATELEGERAVAEAERDRLPVLSLLARLLQEAAEKTKDAAKLDEAGKFKAGVDSLAAGLTDAAGAARSLKQQTLDVENAFSALDRARAEVDRQVRAGQVESYEGERRLRALYEAELPLLAEKVRLLEETAAKTNDPKAVEAARQARERVLALTADAKTLGETFGEQMRRFGTGLQTTARSWAEGVQGILQSSMSALDDFLVSAFTGAKFEAKDALQAIYADVLRLIVRLQVSTPIAQGISAALGNWFGGWSGTSNSVAPEGGGDYHHSGGIVGIDRTRRGSFPPSLWAAAPRYHSGLLPGERPAILQDGEGVFTPAQMRALGSPKMEVNVHNYAGADVQTRRNASGGVDLTLLKKQVVGAVRDDLVNGGELDQLLTRRGLPRRGQ